MIFLPDFTTINIKCSNSPYLNPLGISRETVRKYALKPEGYFPIITRTLNENLVDEYLSYISPTGELRD